VWSEIFQSIFIVAMGFTSTAEAVSPTKQKWPAQQRMIPV